MMQQQRPNFATLCHNTLGLPHWTLVVWCGAFMLGLGHSPPARATTEPQALQARESSAQPLAGGAAADAMAPAGGAEPNKPGQPMSFNPDDPEERIPTQEEANANPLEFGYYLMELARHATDAEEAKDIDRALKFYRTVTLAVPQRAKGPRKVCELYILQEKFGDAEPFCREVLTREDTTLDDFYRWLKLVSDDSTKIPPDVLGYAHEAIEHLRKQPGGEVIALQAECELAVKERKPESMQSCVPRLLELAPNEITTLVFAWHAAVATGKHDQAQDYLERLKELGINDTALEKMKAAATKVRRDQEIEAEGGGCGGAGRLLIWGVLTFAAIMAFRRLLRRR